MPYLLKLITLTSVTINYKVGYFISVIFTEILGILDDISLSVVFISTGLVKGSKSGGQVF